MQQFDKGELTAFLVRASRGTEPRQELTAPDGSRLVVERDPQPGMLERISMIRPDGTTRELTRRYAPADHPPAGYPAAMPFVAGRAVAVTSFDEHGQASAVTWEDVVDPAALAAEIVRESVADGWSEPVVVDVGDLARLASRSIGAELRVLVRGERQRMVQACGRTGAAGTVAVADMPRRPAPPEGA